MPILITITAITYIFVSGSRGGSAGFLDPAGLRKKLEKLQEGSARTDALAIADRLDTLARRYDDATDAAISAYLADVAKWTSSAGTLIEELRQQDQIRGSVFRDFVQLRRSLCETLSAAEWDQVFAT